MKKKFLSTRAVILIEFIGLLIMGGALLMLMQPYSDSDMARWLQLNFFPADEYATISLMDVGTENVLYQAYQGSTMSAWVLCFILSLLVFLFAFIYFARERGML